MTVRVQDKNDGQVPLTPWQAAGRQLGEKLVLPVYKEERGLG
jgi:hypothetical protein